MRHIILLLTLAFSAFFLAGATAFAGSPRNLNHRMENQHKRIEKAITDGRLTRLEADILSDNLDWIKETARRMEKDGLLTQREQDRLKDMLDQNEQMISRETEELTSVYWGNFEERMENQQKRIKEGIRSGSLTRHEANAVQDNLDWIRSTYYRMKKDGRLSFRERRKLDEMLDQNSQLIFKEKHDYDSRFRKRFKDFR